jgi:hypothetical protein
MYLVVTLIIGILALASMFSLMFLPVFPSETPHVTVDPLITSVNSTNSSITYQVQITDTNHRPLTNAHIIIKNMDTIAVNTTNESGMATLNVQVTMPIGLHETYLDVIVKTSKYPTFSSEDMLKVVLRE